MLSAELTSRPEALAIDRDDALHALRNILKSPDFQASPNLAAFLTFSVGRTLDGKGASIKAYTVATEVLGRPVSFDPQADPIVRVEATRLRRAVERYYATEGADDPVKINMPRGGYAVEFVTATVADLSTPDTLASPVSAGTGRSWWKGLSARHALAPRQMGWAAVCLLAVATAGWTWGVIPRTVSVPAPGDTIPQVYSLQVSPSNGLDGIDSTGSITAPIDSTLRIGTLRVGPLLDSTSGSDANGAWGPRLVDAISNSASRFDGVTVFDPAAPLQGLPHDLYTLTGRIETGGALIALRLVHAGSHRIVWSHDYARPLDPAAQAGWIRNVARAVANAVAGHDGAIRTDSLRVNRITTASFDGTSDLDPRKCVATADEAGRTLLDSSLTVARTCLDRALARDPSAPLLLTASAELRLATAQQGARDHSPTDLAEHELQMAVTLDPRNTRALNLLAELRMATDANAALKLGERAMAGNSDDAALLRAQSQRLTRLGRSEAAEALLRQMNISE